MKQTYNLYAWRRLLQVLPVLVVLLLPQLLQAQSANVVISQLYTVGGNAGATYNQDFVELFNRSTTAVNITGWTIQYAAATAAFGTTNNTYTLTAATIPPGGYYLVGIAAAGSAGSSVAADQVAANSTSGLSGTAGKVALATTAATVTYTAPNTFSANVVDMVGYTTSSTANPVNAYEGAAPAGYPTNTGSAILRSSGCTDTNNNGADFVTSPASPRNASTAGSTCTNPVLVANPAALTFSAATGQVANVAAYTLAGFNLAANAAVTISSNDAAVLVSTTGAAGSFARTASVTTTARGTLTQTVTVQYTAPTTVGVTNATISNSDGTRSASVAVAGSAIMAYTWNGSSTSYSTSTSWTPARTTPGSSDILVFDGSVTATPTVVLDYIAGQTQPQTQAQIIGQLLFSNSVAATLTTDSDRSLTLDNNLPGDDLVIGAGSTVTIANSTSAGSSGLAISLASTETASVSGALIFTGYMSAANGRHTLQATGTGAIQFLSGSLFQATSTYSSTAPFGTATANSVIFRNGARFEQFGGTNPFSLNAPSSVAVFEPSSYFLYGIASAAPSLAGRTYGILAYNLSGTSTAVSMNGPLTIQGDLLVLNGTVSISGTGTVAVQGNTQVANAASLTLGGTASVALQGNVTVNNTATLNLSSTTANTVQLNGTTAQALGGTSTATTPIAFNATTTLQINNAAGVTLGLPITVPGTLQLINGLLTTTTANNLTLPAAATIASGSNTSFVNGPVVRPLGGAGTYLFPVGKGAAYRPITLNITAQSGTTYYRAEQFEGNPGQNVTGSSLTRVSRIRSFTISPFASAAAAASTTAAITQPSGFSGTATLSFGTGDFVTDPTQLVVAKRPNAASPWVNLGYGSSMGSAASGTVTSGAFTSFSDFVLGTTSADLTANPLPVVLTRFGATRQANGAVQVSWATASEQQSAFFEVQRSLDGRTFTAVATVAANGTTTQAHTYTSSDPAAPAGKLYYRLLQADTDGSTTFSPVVTLAATEATTTPVLYPNPAHDQLTVVAAAGTEVQVLDLVGRVLQIVVLPASGQLSTDALLPGTYLLRLCTNGQQHTLRFAKE